MEVENIGKRWIFLHFPLSTTHQSIEFRILYIRKIKPQALKSTLHIPAAKHRRYFMNCCSQGNVTLWILIALLVLGSKDGIFCSNIFNGCGLPIIVALLFCLYKNGTLSAILTPPCNCCPCHWYFLLFFLLFLSLRQRSWVNQLRFSLFSCF